MTTLVVVDDELLVTDFLTFLLEGQGYAVHAAADGKEALALIDRVRPALVITDLMMPIMSGLELARALRQNSELSGLPIILCTAVAEPVTQQEQHLFNAILKKPYAGERIISLVAQHVDKTA
jgi:CheY-like chemotaxis protein